MVSQVKVLPSGHTFGVEEHETILEAALRQDVVRAAARLSAAKYRLRIILLRHCQNRIRRRAIPCFAVHGLWAILPLRPSN